MPEAQSPLPGFAPSLSQRVLERLIEDWISAVANRPRGRADKRAGDLLMAALLLAREDKENLDDRPELVIEAFETCGQEADSFLDRLPLQAILDYWLHGKPHPEVIEAISRNLNHHSSSIRIWFHHVAWMIRPELDVDRVRPVLLNNLSNMLGGVLESAGLLAILHPDKSVLDAAADAFEPEEGGEQYRGRLKWIREEQWNLQAYNLFLAENSARKVIWDAAKSLEDGQ